MIAISTMQNNELTPKESYTWLTKIMPGCRNAELEKVIATSAKWSCKYAGNVLKGRFELAEPKIAKSVYAKEYKRKFNIQ